MCVCVCVCVCVYEPLYIYIYTCTYTYTQHITHSCQLCIYHRVWSRCSSSCRLNEESHHVCSACGQVCMHVCMYMCVCMYVSFMYICSMHVCRDAFVYRYLDICVCRYAAVTCCCYAVERVVSLAKYLFSKVEYTTVMLLFVY